MTASGAAAAFAARPPVTRGLAFAVLAIVIFAAQDGISKHMAETYPPAFVVMIRYWAFAAFVLLLAARSHGGLRAASRSRRPVLQWARGALLGVQVIVMITAFAKVGLANSHAILACAPLLVAALSQPILGERVGWRRWAAISVGFVGVLVILRPGAGALDPNIWLAVLGSALMAAYAVMTRLTGREDPPNVSFFYTGLGGAAVLTVIGPFYWTNFATPDWFWMAALCVTGAAGHYFLIRAFALTPAVLVQPIGYLQLVLASMIGVVIFGEILHPATVAGAALVVGAGVFTAWREHVRSRR